jgi:hypothetical protein
MALLSGSALIAMPALANTCADLAKLAAPDATITAATVESGAFQSPKDGLGVTTKVTAPFCRVEGIAKSERPRASASSYGCRPPTNGTAACWRAAISANPARRTIRR